MYSTSVLASEFKFGQICITPYPSQQADIPSPVNEILLTKMSQILQNQGVVADNSERFIMVPHIIISNEGTTATIPSKTSVKITVLFAIGDGITGTRFYNYTVGGITGIGDDRTVALMSAVRKIHTDDPELRKAVTEGTGKIVEYYNNITPSLIKKAQAAFAATDFKTAITTLTPIPAACKYFNESQELLGKCGAKIIERDNNRYIREAESAWATNPNQTGAEEVRSHLIRIINPSADINKRIEKINSAIQRTLTQKELREYELTKLHISTQAEIKEAEIQATSSIASSFISSIPQLIIRTLSWF